jgi:antitoxin HigA-1
MSKKIKPVHPGEILREEFITPLGLSMNRMAVDLRAPVTRIANIVNQRCGISAANALRFVRYFKDSPTFWMNLQTRYDLQNAEDQIAAKVEGDGQPQAIVGARQSATSAPGQDTALLHWVFDLRVESAAVSSAPAACP